MSKARMEALIDIDDWYASLSNTFIRMYNVEKPLHVLRNFSLDKLIMQEVSYHIAKGLSTRLHWKKKAPWPNLPLQIELYEIRSFKHADVEVEEMKKYPFDVRSYNPYDLHCLLKYHCMRVQFK